MMKQMSLNKVNRVVIGLYLLSTIGFVLDKGLRSNGYYVFIAIVGLVALSGPRIVERAICRKVTNEMRLIYFVFCYFSIVIGLGFRGYYHISWLDLLLHFIAGFFMALLGLMLFHYQKGWGSDFTAQDRVLMVVLPLVMAIAGGAVWEFYEYGLYVFSGVDTLNVATTGVHDTIGDMLVCSLGGIIMAWRIERYYFGKRKNYLVRVLEDFYLENQYE